eukprot:COSAG06_NODE_167_length_21546_cov_35.001352_27_plen_46_part_00
MTGCSGIDHKWTGIGGNGQHLRFTGQRDQVKGAIFWVLLELARST